MVRLERGGEKIEVQPEEVIDCQDRQALDLLKGYSNLFVSMGTTIDEKAMEEKRRKAAAAQLKLSERQALIDKREAAKAAGVPEGSDESVELTYEAVMEMSMEDLVKLNDEKKLGVKITKSVKVESVREKVALALELMPVSGENEAEEEERGQEGEGQEEEKKEE